MPNLANPLAAAGATVLLTARQDLPFLTPDATLRLDLMPKREAEDLFAVYYRGVDHLTDLSPEEQRSIAAIVDELGRHTLAIRLAGAYAATARRSLDAVERELVDPRRALIITVFGEPEGVQKVFDATYRALDEGAKRLFAALSIFVGSDFSRDASLAVARGLGLGPEDAPLDLLVSRALAEPSTNPAMPTSAGHERLRLHPLLRAFAGIELEKWALEERETAQRSILEHYATAVANVPEIALAADENNIVGALESARGSGDDALVVALCTGMQDYWARRGKIQRSQRYLPRGLEAAQRIATASPMVENSRLAVASLELSNGDLLFILGDNSNAERHYLAGLALYQEVSGDRGIRGKARALRMLGELALRRGDMKQAQDYFQRSLDLYGDARDMGGEAAILLRLGDLGASNGETNEASRSYLESLRILQQFGDTGYVTKSTVLRALGDIEKRQGNVAEARKHYMESLEMARQVLYRRDEAYGLRALGDLAYQSENTSEAEAYYRQSFEVWEEIGDLDEMGVTWHHLGDVKLQEGDLEGARLDYLQSLNVLRLVQDNRGQGHTLRLLGDLDQLAGNLPNARANYLQSLEILRASGVREGEGRTLCSLGRLDVREGNLDVAETELRQSLQIALEVASKEAEAEALEELGTLLLSHRGSAGHEEGCEDLGRAVSFFRDIGRERRAETLEGRLRNAGCL